jgi:hypothetical protein
MSVTATTSSTGGNLAALLSASALASSFSNPPPSNSSDAASGDGHGLATNVQLSDNVKAVLARQKPIRLSPNGCRHGPGVAERNRDTSQATDTVVLDAHLSDRSHHPDMSGDIW